MIIFNEQRSTIELLVWIKSIDPQVVAEGVALKMPCSRRWSQQRLRDKKICWREVQRREVV